jgi:hypothetical protein
MAACAPEGGDALEQGQVEAPESDLAAALRVRPLNVGGCDNAWFWAANASETVALQVYVLGFTDRVLALGDEMTASYDLTDEAVGATIRVGTRVRELSCTDTFEDGPVVDRWLSAIEGTIHVRGEPDPAASTWIDLVRADLRLEGAVFEDDATGQLVELDDLVIRDVLIGEPMGG